MTNSEVIVYVKLVQKRKPKNKKIYVLCSQPPLKKLIPSPNIGIGLNPPLLRIFKNLQPPPLLNPGGILTMLLLLKHNADTFIFISDK